MFLSSDRVSSGSGNTALLTRGHHALSSNYQEGGKESLHEKCFCRALALVMSEKPVGKGRLKDHLRHTSLEGRICDRKLDENGSDCT